jgi:multiple sugar transport system permease protein/putative aldouronate transport system permease protein
MARTNSPAPRAVSQTAAPAGLQSRGRTWQRVKQSWQLYVLLALPMLYLLVFQYWPMYGAQIAFRNFNAIAGVTGSPWVGFQHFQRFISSYDFTRTLTNTLVISFYSLAIGFPFPIMLALGLNYVQRNWFKNTVQLVTYAPYFISTVVMAGIILQFLSPDAGLFNQILKQLGFAPINVMANPELFPHVYVWSGLWQTMGFSAIIYLATLSSVDPTLHEAAIVDGASKLQRMRYIDLPELMPVAIVLLVLSMGGILSTGFEKILLLQNPLNLRTSEVIDTYVYRVGLASTVPNYSYAAAIGLFKSIIGLILVLVVDRFAKRMGQRGAL